MNIIEMNAHYAKYGYLKCKTSANNIAIGYKPLTSPFYVDTTVFCQKCKMNHKIEIPAYSKQMIFKSK